MDGVTLLDRARSAGLSVHAEGNRLVVRGPRSQDDLAQLLLTKKQEILVQLAAEDPDVTWRVAAMRERAPPNGPIPFLVARHVRSDRTDLCLSCQTALADAASYRCTACRQAAWVVTNNLPSNNR